MVVVLPAPFGPRMPVTAPRAALSVSPSTAVVWPYRLTSAPISTAGVCGTVLTDASLRRSESALCYTGHLRPCGGRRGHAPLRAGDNSDRALESPLSISIDPPAATGSESAGRSAR